VDILLFWIQLQDLRSPFLSNFFLSADSVNTIGINNIMMQIKQTQNPPVWTAIESLAIDTKSTANEPISEMIPVHNMPLPK